MTADGLQQGHATAEPRKAALDRLMVSDAVRGAHGLWRNGHRGNVTQDCCAEATTIVESIMARANSSSLLDRMREAQTLNSLLAGGDLRRAAERLVQISGTAHWSLLGVDGSGERLVGAALCDSDGLDLVDRSQRLDGKSVLLVTGHTAGTAALAEAATAALSLGAAHVEAVTLNSEPSTVPGCARVISIGG